MVKNSWLRENICYNTIIELIPLFEHMKIFKIFYILIIIIFVISLIQIKKLPERSEVMIDMLQSPLQTISSRTDFSFPYRGKTFNVKPVADYELWGLVVSKNNINALFNIYSDKNSVNLKDICVVWGKNIENGIFRDKNISFSSGEWTCYSTWNGGLNGTFYPNNLSNNHLLTSDSLVQKLIRTVNIGDQIHLQGSLVDYAEVGENNYRMTSISRDDSNQTSRSRGACEIVYVDKFEILKHNQATWHFINNLSKYLFASLIIIQFYLFIREYKIFLKKS